MLAGFKSGEIERIKNTLKYLNLTPKLRKDVLQRVLWRMKDNAKQAVSQQRTPDGKPWAPRKRKLQGGVRQNKLLKLRAKRLNSKVEQQAKIGRLHYSESKDGEIGAIHQYGLPVSTAPTEKDKAILEKLKAQNHEPATPKQARRLKELGYQVSNGKTKHGKRKFKKVRMKTIKETMSRGQAGLIIRLMEKKQGKQKPQKAMYEMPARPFLDENEQRNAEIITKQLLKVFEEAKKQR